MTRRPLPQRRHSMTFNLSFWKQDFSITVGFYEDHVTPGEVFISGPKSGVDVDGIARDSAVMMSLALQHGVSIDTIRHAVTRRRDGAPMTVVGAIADFLANPGLTGQIELKAPAAFNQVAQAASSSDEGAKP